MTTIMFDLNTLSTFAASLANALKMCYC